MKSFDEQYLEIMVKILNEGVNRPDRTGIGSKAIWGGAVEVDLEHAFPMVTTRKTSFRLAFEETWFFLRGETDTKKLEEKKIKIWKGNTTREFLDNRGLNYLPEGHMGKGYGFQWRNFGGDYEWHYWFEHGRMDPYDPQNKNTRERDNSGVDQVVNLLEGIKQDPNGRRHIITGWNPQQLDEMALPPCHLYNQYQVLDGKLNSSFVMRSHDWLYGGPFNFMGYALLNIAFSNYLNLKPGKLVYFGNDIHIYNNQLEIASRQVDRIPFPSPQIILHKDVKTFDDLLSLEYEDFELVGYQAHEDFKNKPPMAV